MSRLKTLVILFTYFLFLGLGAWGLELGTLFAQDATGEIEMADAMRESGKIYVVVAVLVTIFIGIIVYLFVIDRKVSGIEKDITGKKVD